MLSLKFDAARKDERDPSIMTVSFKPDLFTGVLAATLKRYIENTLTFTQFRIRFDRQPPVTRDEFEKQVNAANRDVIRKNCKKYGVSLAKLTFDPLFGEKVVRSLRPLSDHYYAAELLKERDAVYLLLLDECEFLKELHFRSPFLEAAGAEIAIYGQYGKTRYRISFDMEKLQQA